MIEKFNSRNIYIFTILILLFSLNACVTTGSSKNEPAGGQESQSKMNDNKSTGTLLIFSEREAGSEPYTTRIFVNSKFMRISENLSPADFVLFDRAERTIYNVTREEKSILVIKDNPHDIKSPIEIKYEEESQPSGAIPKINGRQATHYRFFVNGSRCYDSVTLGEEFLPDVLDAFREFRKVLANEHAKSVNNIPKEIMDACDMAVNIFYAVKHMDHGIPIREWNTRGYQRFLKDYREDISVPTSSFELPANFQRFSMSDAPPLVGH